MKTRLLNYLWLISITFIVGLPSSATCDSSQNMCIDPHHIQRKDPHKDKLSDANKDYKPGDKRNLTFGAFLLSNARADFGYATGRFIGIDRDYIEVGLFLPVPFFGTWLPFGEVRGYRFNDARWGFNAGVGIRSIDFYGRILGANLYYDELQSRFGGGFHRIGLGVEWLGNCWDFRINGYFPLNSHAHRGKEVVFDDFIGDFVSICREEESATTEGFDAEIGFPLACWEDFIVYGGAGPYYYRTFFESDYWGAQGRLELRWKSYVSFQFRTSYDNVNRTQTQGKIWITFPFDFFSSKPSLPCDCYGKLLSQPVYRNGIIFTDKCCIYTNNF